MTKGTTAPRYTRALMLKWYRKYREPGSPITQEEICSKIGCHLSTVSRWFRIFEQEDAQAPQDAPSPPPNGNGKKTPTADQKTQPGTTEALLDENSYLRWWNQGERKGYVDRLLKEMQRD